MPRQATITGSGVFATRSPETLRNRAGYQKWEIAKKPPAVEWPLCGAFPERPGHRPFP